MYYIYGHVRAIPTYRVYQLYDYGKTICEILCSYHEQTLFISTNPFLLVRSMAYRVLEGPDYAQGGNELEWQCKLQTKTQKPGERLADSAGAL